MIRLTVAALAVLTLAACETTRPYPVVDTVSIRYDPYNYSMAELQESADAACVAKGARSAERVDTEINTEAVRWAYMNFECF